MQKSDARQQGVVLDDKNQKQPADKDRAQTVHKTKPGHTPLAASGEKLATSHLWGLPTLRSRKQTSTS
jgi:hypothetical protein